MKEPGRSSLLLVMFCAALAAMLLTLRCSKPDEVESLSAVSLASSTVVGGNPVQGTVTLNGTAPSGGAAVTLSSNNPVVTVPGTVTVGSGSSSASFSATTSAVTTSTPVTITATYGGDTRTVGLTVNAVTLKADAGGPYLGQSCNSLFAPPDPNKCNPRRITMSGLNSTSSLYPIAHYFWDCGQAGNPNGCTADNPTPSFLYFAVMNNGSTINYTVTLTIEDTQGNRATATTTVTVTQQY